MSLLSSPRSEQFLTLSSSDNPLFSRTFLALKDSYDKTDNSKFIHSTIKSMFQIILYIAFTQLYQQL